MKSPLRLVVTIGAIAAFVAMPRPAPALLVDLSVVTLEPDRHVRDISIKNTDPVDVVVQVDADRWASGEDGHLTEAPTDDLIVAPRVVTIPAHSAQIVRVAWRSAPTDGERAYRVKIHQVAEVGSGHVSAAVGVNYVVYLFAATPILTKASVAVSLARLDDQHVRMTFVNDGQLHAMFGPTVITRGGQAVYDAQPFGVLLGGGRRSVVVPLARGGPVQLQDEVDGKKSTETIDVP